MEFRLETFHRNVSREALIEDLRKVNALLKSENKKLTFRSYGRHGKYSAGTIADRFGGWNTALEAAQIDATLRRDIPVDDLFDNLRSVWIAKGRQPVFRDMGRPPSQYVASTYAGRFGGWRNTLEEFLKSVASERSEPHRVPSTVVAADESRAKRSARQPSLRTKFRVMRRDRFMCTKCGRAPASHPGLVLEIDHIQAWSKGGETFEKNLQTLCYDCNRGKSDLKDR